MIHYGFVYITTNKLNGMKYIGQCSGNPEDPKVKRYFGSGKAILRAIKKNGIENFEKEIVGYAESLQALNALERQVISEHNAVKSRNFYNIAPGGRASLGFTGKKHSKERNDALSKQMMGHSVTENARKAASQTGKKFANLVLNTQKFTCPVCGTTGNKGNMMRWHFTNCRHMKP